MEGPWGLSGVTGQGWRPKGDGKVRSEEARPEGCREAGAGLDSGPLVARAEAVWCGLGR